MNIPILKLPFSHDDIRLIGEDIEAVLRSSFLTGHDKVREFERLFADFCGVTFA